MAEIEERPHKKRRFFVDDSPESAPPLSPTSSPPGDLNDGPDTNTGPASVGQDGSLITFRDAFCGITGTELSDRTILGLQSKFDGSMHAAINAYFDGSWTIPEESSVPRSALAAPASSVPVHSDRDDIPVRSQPNESKSPASPLPKLPAFDSMPRNRYIGALGVTAWATTSGSNLLKPDDVVKIERTKKELPQKFGRPPRMNVIVRFTDSRGKELGRLEQDVATWISALIDQKICEFEGNCIYAPERLRTNDTVYLQLRCYLLKSVFEASNFVKPTENNRRTGLFEARETQDELNLRYRQIGLVKLFSDINLQPSQINAMTAKHKREGILQAAEVAEQYEANKKASGTSTPKEPGSSPPSEENEEGEELEQDQLDTLYKKAQSFDFNTPAAEPAQTFVMELRKYQKQALHWMLNKETSQKQDYKEQSMHPLWEEYQWPTKDANDKELPAVAGQANFYVNPYSSELSLDFPVQEQNCLGGILADEMGLGKTIEMLSLIHTHMSPEQQAAMTRNGSSKSSSSLPSVQKASTYIESAPATTLVVAPMSLLAQWASEAEKTSRNGSLKILMYYGTEKNVDLKTLCCTANASSAPNVIITSYGVVLSEFNTVASYYAGNKGASNGLFSIEYYRIILDEAHMIKNRQSKTAKACYELSAIHRWVLTGTPIVNRRTYPDGSKSDLNHMTTTWSLTQLRRS